MLIHKYLIFVLLIVLLNTSLVVHSCGCYGSRTCTPKGERCDPTINNLCHCDCCPPCNRCEQFFPIYCFKDRFRYLSDKSIMFQFQVNQTIPSFEIADQSDGLFSHYLWDPCLDRPLPDGISLVESSKLGIYQLIGRPKKLQEKLYYEVIFKGLVSQILWMNFTISIVNDQQQL